ncbi:MAG: hypothetical protein E7029_03285 [Planctomycetaceae bacterium]|nr:hypothetical protein [Planctomycetaceae bacterium]
MSHIVSYASVQGRSHVADNTPCEDAAYAEIRKIRGRTYTALCVCDGGGSCAWSQIGAEITSRHVVDWLFRNADNFSRFSERELLNAKTSLRQAIFDRFADEWKSRIHEELTKIGNLASDDYSAFLGNQMKNIISEWSRSCIVEKLPPASKGNCKGIDHYARQKLYTVLLPQWQRFVESELPRLVRERGLLDSENERTIIGQTECPYNEYGCTIVACLVGDDGSWVTLQLGDGGIFAIDECERKPFVLSAPDNGEYSNTTTFITSENAIEKMRLLHSEMPQFREKRLSDFMLFSDGPEQCLIEKWVPFEPSTSELFASLLTDWDTPRRSHEKIIDAIKQMQEIKVFDDCTLGLIKKSMTPQQEQKIEFQPVPYEPRKKTTQSVPSMSDPKPISGRDTLGTRLTADPGTRTTSDPGTRLTSNSGTRLTSNSGTHPTSAPARPKSDPSTPTSDPSSNERGMEMVCIFIIGVLLSFIVFFGYLVLRPMVMDKGPFQSPAPKPIESADGEDSKKIEEMTHKTGKDAEPQEFGHEKTDSEPKILPEPKSGDPSPMIPEDVSQDDGKAAPDSVQESDGGQNYGWEPNGAENAAPDSVQESDGGQNYGWGLNGAGKAAPDSVQESDGGQNYGWGLNGAGKAAPDSVQESDGGQTNGWGLNGAGKAAPDSVQESDGGQNYGRGLNGAGKAAPDSVQESDGGQTNGQGPNDAGASAQRPAVFPNPVEDFGKTPYTPSVEVFDKPSEF